MGERAHLGATSPPVELIGRVEERRAMETALDTARGGRSSVLVLRGEAGIGKSSLLQHLVREASGFRVIHTTAVESEMELPYAALHQICMPIMGHLDQIPEPQRDTIRAAFGQIAAAPPDRLLLGLAVLGLVSAASTDRPILCVVDDAQWLDTASAQALTFLARRLFAEPVCVVFATRTMAGDLDGLPSLEVTGLRDLDAKALLRDQVPVPLDPRVRDQIIAETGGNPLALVEWPKGLSPSELAGGFRLIGRLPVSSHSEEVFRRRVVDLPPDTRLLLTVAAAETTGDALTVWRAAELLELGPDAADAAVEAGLLEIGVHVGFRHPLARSGSYAAATVAERQAAHRALAEATDVERDPDRRAWHRALGSPGPDEAVADELERSARRARDRGGVAAAAALLARSVALSDDASMRARRSLEAAEAMLEAGSFEPAAEVLARVDRRAVSPLEGALLDLAQARRAALGGEIAKSPALLLDVAQRLEPLEPDLARTTYIQALAAMSTTGRFARDVDLLEVATAAAGCPAPEAPSTEQWLLSGLSAVTVEGPAAAAPALRMALNGDVGPAAGARFHLVGMQCGAAVILWAEQDLHRLAALQVDARRQMGAITMLPSALNNLADVMILKGDLPSAESLLREADRILDALEGSLMTWAGAVLVSTRGDDDAPARIEEMVRTATAAGNALTLTNAQWSAVRYHNALGEYDAALRVGVEVMTHRWEWGAHRNFPELVEAAARCGDLDLAASTADQLAETATASGSNWGLGLLARCRALIADDDDTDALFRESVDRLAQTEVRPELARSQLLYGEWLRRQRRKFEARQQLRAAHEAMTEIGMVRFAERAARELTATGDSLRPRGVTPTDALTPQESHIARLAAEGLTNSEIGERLFISARTVEWHLHKTYLKLGISSRRGLRDVLPLDIVP